MGEQSETVWLIDWAQPEANHFAVAEEVTVLGQHTKRPDVVLYVNGIALVTLELKRSKVAVSEGIRQTIGNQKPEFIRPFFTHRAAGVGRQRRRGAALRRDRHAGEVLAGVERAVRHRQTRSTGRSPSCARSSACWS